MDSLNSDNDMHRRCTIILLLDMNARGKYLQNSDVLESGEVTLGDACEVIPIQLPAKTDTQTYMNNSSLFSL